MKRDRSPSAAFVLAAFLAAVLTAVSTLVTQSAEAAEKVKICLPLWKADQMKTAVILAKEQSFFAKNGIEAEFVNHQPVALKQDYNRGKRAMQIDDFAQSDVSRLNAVASSKQGDRPCDFAVVLMDAFFQSGVSADKFAPLLFSRYGHGYDTHLIVPVKSQIKSAADLKGKKIALGPVMSRMALDAMLETAGVASADVTIVANNPFQRVQQMRDGEIDAAIVYNPAMAILLSEGSVRVVEENLIEKYLKMPVPHTVFLVNSIFSEKNAKLIPRVVDAIENGNRALSDDPTLLATVTEEYAKEHGEKVHSYGASKVTLAKSAQIMGDFKLYRVTSVVNGGSSAITVIEALNKFQNALVQRGYIAKTVDLSSWSKGRKL